MLDRVVEQACKEEILSREDKPTEQRVEAAFLYHSGLSYRRVQRVVGRSYEAVRQWYHRLANLFDPNPNYHSTVAIDETKLKVEETEVYVWAAVDLDTFEVIPIEFSPGRYDLDASLFVNQVLKRYRGDPAILVDRGPWYNWALDDLEVCELRDPHRLRRLPYRCTTIYTRYTRCPRYFVSPGRTKHADSLPRPALIAFHKRSCSEDCW